VLPRDHHQQQEPTALPSWPIGTTASTNTVTRGCIATLRAQGMMQGRMDGMVRGSPLDSQEIHASSN